MSKPRPIAAIADRPAYQVPRHGAPVDLWLAGNEGRIPDPALLRALGDHDPEVIRRYPNALEVQVALAVRIGVPPEQLVVTAGADDALDRCCRALLCAGRNLVLPVPTFEMIQRYAEVAGGEVRSVPWPGGAYPVEAVLDAADETTAIITVVTPNNPTGAVATASDIRRLSEAAPHAVILVDGAYAEFADVDLTEAALSLPNALVTRTLSKAWGLAGLRVGYAVGPVEMVGWLRRVGNPYAVASSSLALALRQLEDDAPMRHYVERVQGERETLRATFAKHGIDTPESRANFVFVESERARWIGDALAGLGIAIRTWPGHPALGEAARVTLPGTEAGFSRLHHAVLSALAPEALLFDLDGVIADVSESYREAIRATLASFGVDVTEDDIAAAKAAGDANNDWVLSQRMLAARGKEVAFEEVKARFEALYQGEGDTPGLWEREGLLEDRELLEALCAGKRCAVVTGRPRQDLERFLSSQNLGAFFETTVCMEDAALKPDPAPVRLALERLGVERAWMIGDTPDDLRAARGAEVVPLGFVPPRGGLTPEALTAAGAARVLSSLRELKELWPS